MAKVESGYQITLSWVPVINRNIPGNAVRAGSDLYVIRGQMGDEWVPGKYICSHGVGYVPYGGQEVAKDDVEVLCVTGCGSGNFYEWRHGRGGNVPKSSVCASIASDGNPVFVARARVQGEMAVGKVHLGHDCAYMPWGGREVPVDEYEVLVWLKK